MKYSPSTVFNYKNIDSYIFVYTVYSNPGKLSSSKIMFPKISQPLCLLKVKVTEVPMGLVNFYYYYCYILSLTSSLSPESIGEMYNNILFAKRERVFFK